MGGGGVAVVVEDKLERVQRKGLAREKKDHLSTGPCFEVPVQ